MKCAGYSVGASSVGMVVVQRENGGPSVLHAEARPHDGDPKGVLEGLFRSVLEHLDKREDPEEVSVIFMPQSSGPCRFGQYTVEIANRLKQKRIPKATLLSLSCEDGYAGLSQSFQIRS